MTNKPKSNFARRVRTAKPRDRKYEIRDDVIAGLGLAIQPTGVRTFFVSRMVRGRRRYAKVASADTMTVPEARREARKLLATVKKDAAPRTPGRPMDAFAEEFLDRYARHWKPRTLQSNRYLLRNHILPAFAHLTVDAITVEYVRDWFASMAERPGSANRAMPLLSVMMRMAELWGYRPHNSNPCNKIRRYRTEPKERFLTAEEMARLNAVLARDEFYCPHIVAIVRLLMLIGCRAGEIASLEWDWIRDKRIHLPDSKSGPRTVWLSSAARAVIDAIPRYSPDCPYLFPGRPPTRPIDSFGYQSRAARNVLDHIDRTGAWIFPAPRANGPAGPMWLRYFWQRVRIEAEMSDVRLHDLRHAHATFALRQGESVLAIARLLGHASAQTTAGYAHLADAHLVEAAERVGTLLAQAMGYGAEPQAAKRTGCVSI